MPRKPLTDVTAREVVHLLILEELGKVRDGQAVALKGGVNLRLFFQSVRYSEDIDLDGVPEASQAIRSTIKRIFRDRAFFKRLRKLGIRGLDPGGGPNKDTSTTFRYKFGVVLPGDIRHPTKVEVSFRPRHPGDRTIMEPLPNRFIEEYDIAPLPICRYVREAAVRQKIEALGGRSQAQARDVFDLHALVGGDVRDEMLAFLAGALTRNQMDAAYERALSITFAEYEGQVIEFLATEGRETYGTEGAWDEMRLKAAGLIEAVIQYLGEA
jgi:hypothetical protein